MSAPRPAEPAVPRGDLSSPAKPVLLKSGGAITMQRVQRFLASALRDPRETLRGLWLAVGVPVLLGFMGFAIDLGRMYMVRGELNQEVRRHIGALATPESIQFAPALPKTRSGKIMRRILRKIAEGHTDGFGDISTLADPAIVEALVAGRGAK